jgi:cellulose synthase/poly-beta-1,6-N-acetylglucosamine synthase-like glycosyltransferase
MSCIFFISILLIGYTYLGYPLWIALSKIIWPRPISRCNRELAVSVVIAVCNEEKNIAGRLQNILVQEYPLDKLEIIVVSDGSSDRTVEIMRQMGIHNLLIIDSPVNQGKAVALNKGVAKAHGEIIVFTDARQEFRADAIKNLVANFADETVGCVSGELHFLEDPASKIEAEMGAYWRYEKFIRRSESASGSVVGATGCIYAIRRELYQPLPTGTILDDVLTPMNIARMGKRVLFDTQAVAYDIISKNASQEWRRKVRTLAGNWQLLSLAPWIMFPWKNPIWWRYVSHKLLRLLVPFGMVILFVVSLLIPGSFFSMFVMMQLAFYGISLSGFLLPATRSIRLVNISYFFMVMNAAAVAGFWKWLTGGCATAWQPAYNKDPK